MPELTDALTYYVIFLFSTTLHEAAHAWAAMRGGDLTAYHGGQVSLDPLPHIRREPFGMVVLPLLSVMVSGWPFGFASAPYDPRWALAHPRRAALMSLAGPAANLLLVVIAGIGLRAGEAAGVFMAPGQVSFGQLADAPGGGIWAAVAFFLGALFSLNLVLFAFNLIPLPPLDGSGALPLLMSREQSAAYQQFLWSNPMLVWVGMIIAWQLFDVIFGPIFTGAVNLLYPGMRYG